MRFVKKFASWLPWFLWTILIFGFLRTVWVWFCTCITDERLDKLSAWPLKVLDLGRVTAWKFDRVMFSKFMRMSLQLRVILFLYLSPSHKIYLSWDKRQYNVFISERNETKYPGGTDTNKSKQSWNTRMIWQDVTVTNTTGNIREALMSIHWVASWSELMDEMNQMTCQVLQKFFLMPQ